MSIYRLRKRIEGFERTMKANQRFHADCICFPGDKEPVVVWLGIEAKMILELQCPIHGQRCKLYWLPFQAELLRKERWPQLLSHSPQYQKAWLATFPPPLWPAKEEVIDGFIFLRLKDGTLLEAGRAGHALAEEVAIDFVPDFGDSPSAEIS